MQLFIKAPSPYNKTFVIKIDENQTFNDIRNIINELTCYSSLKYYLYNGSSIFAEDRLNLTIKEFNRLYPYKKILNDCTLYINIRPHQ